MAGGDVQWLRGRGLEQRAQSRGRRLVDLAFDMTLQTSVPLALALTIGGLTGSWALSYALGGASVCAPVWFLLVVLLATFRFGWRGALVTALVSGMLAGPLLPAVVATGEAQPVHVWLDTAVLFVASGLLMAALIGLSRQSVDEELRLLRIERDTLRALDRDEFEIWYQPVIELTTGHVVGAEALLRWWRPGLGLITPDSFIPSVEETPAILELGRYVLQEAMAQLAAWRSTVLAGHPRFTVSVNVSAVELQSPEFVDHVVAALEQSELDPSWLALEVTETAIITDVAAVAEQLDALGRIGVRIAIDDFGAGYSSLSHLRDLPADAIKIDHTFVARIADEGRAASFVRLVTELGSELGLAVIAEGVETREQAECLRALGCRFAQGFYFTRPVLAADLVVLVASESSTALDLLDPPSHLGQPPEHAHSTTREKA